MIFPMHKYSGSYINTGFAKTSPKLSKHLYGQSAVNQWLLQSRQKGAETWGKLMAALIPKEGSWIHWICSHLALVQFYTFDVGRISVYFCWERKNRLNLFLLACSRACWKAISQMLQLHYSLSVFCSKLVFLWKTLLHHILSFSPTVYAWRLQFSPKPISLVPWPTEKFN